MRMPRSVLVTLDGSAASEAILPFLPAVLRHGDQVVLLQVAPPPHEVSRGRVQRIEPVMHPSAVVLEAAEPEYAEDEDHALRRTRAEVLDYLADRGLLLRNEGFDVRCEVVIDEDPQRAIVAFARQLGPLFIAMATHGRSGLSHALNGSVTEHVIRSRVAPVLVVRP